MREFDLLDYVYATTPTEDERVIIGPGDDMALLRLAGRDLLAAVDQVVARRHFTDDTAPALIGRKAVARSLSDVAAMAGRPVAALAAATLPPGFGTASARALFDGMRVMAAAHGCPLVGGDIAFHADDRAPLTCSVTVLAEPGPAGGVRRDGARVGDTLYVTGVLGGAMESGGGAAPRHLTFEPRIGEALALAETLGGRLHAMIDLSDGLGRDAAHLAAGADLRIEIDAAHIPCRDGLPWRRAAGEGEDYELLFAATGDVPTVVAGTLAVTAIGTVVPATGGVAVTIRDGDDLVPGDDLGWEHGT